MSLRSASVRSAVRRARCEEQRKNELITINALHLIGSEVNSINSLEIKTDRRNALPTVTKQSPRPSERQQFREDADQSVWGRQLRTIGDQRKQRRRERKKKQAMIDELIEESLLPCAASIPIYPQSALLLSNVAAETSESADLCGICKPDYADSRRWENNTSIWSWLFVSRHCRQQKVGK